MHYARRVEPDKRPIVLLSDTHLGPHSSSALERDLARALHGRPGHEILLAGDVFDLSFAPSTNGASDLLASLLDRAPEFTRTLRNHVAAGHPLTIVPGNHDAALSERRVQRLLTGRLGVQAGAPITITPWFVRRGDLHIEHGHVYDPDNAPVHPLVDWSDGTEPLGIALTRRFIARVGAWHFTHAHDTTPVEALRNAFRVYRHRAPIMIAQYFHTALQICLEAGPRRTFDPKSERSAGHARVPGFAEQAGLDEADVFALLGQAPSPTHLDARAVFLRLYFDRVFATLILGTGVAALPKFPLAALPALGSLLYLCGSVARGKSRSTGMPETGLLEAAGRIRSLTGARRVIFGHTHLETDSEGYTNAGSFAFPRTPGRPYLLVDPRGGVERARLIAS